MIKRTFFVLLGSLFLIGCQPFEAKADNTQTDPTETLTKIEETVPIIEENVLQHKESLENFQKTYKKETITTRAHTHKELEDTFSNILNATKER